MDFIGFRDANIYVEGVGIVRTSMSIENGKIGMLGGVRTEGLTRIPEDLIVIPGFVDKHTHGANNADFMNPTKEDIKKITSAIVQEGTTSCLATTMTQSMDNIKAAVKNVEVFKEINEASLNTIKQVSYACEENGLEFTKYLAENKIVASIGHSNSDHETVIKAVDLGATSVTHTYNAQRGIHHRDIGVVGSAMLDDRLQSEIICDLIHVSPAAIKLLHKNKGKDGIFILMVR